MVIERPSFGGDQNPQKCLLFFERCLKKVLICFLLNDDS